MNAARLTRRWQEADEINDPATGLVTRDFLRAELAQVREEIAALRGELRSEITAVRGEITGVRGDLRAEIASVRVEIWRVVLTVFGAQVVLIGIMVTILFQILR